MTRKNNSMSIQDAVQLVVDEGMDALPRALQILLNQAMQVERAQALDAEPYQRTSARRGYANGFKQRTLDSRLGRLVLDIPQTRNVEFYPSVLERGIRSERALKLAVAEMYIRGVSTRKVQYVMEKICGLSVTSAQVSRATALLDEELQRWRNRPLESAPYLILDARYEKVRIGPSVVSCAVLVAIGVKSDGRRTILGVSCSASESLVHWRQFLQGLQHRGLFGVTYIVSDDHPGIVEAAACCFPGVPWQRCQFHLMQNAMHHVPRLDMRKPLGLDLRKVFNAPTREEAERELRLLVEKYHAYPSLAAWMEQSIPQGFAVYALPETHQKSMRTTNMLERLNRELKRRTNVVGIFPNEQSLLRLVTALAVEESDGWEAGLVYLKMEHE